MMTSQKLQDAAPSGNIDNLLMVLFMDPFRLHPKHRQPTSHANKIDAALSKNIDNLDLVHLNAAPSGNIDNLLLANSMDPSPFHPKMSTTYNPCKTKMMQRYPKYRHLRIGVS
jgi:hypothetical protein